MSDDTIIILSAILATITLISLRAIIYIVKTWQYSKIAKNSRARMEELEKLEEEGAIKTIVIYLEKENYFIPKNKEYYPNERKYQKKIDSRIGEIKVLDDFLCYSNQNVKSITFDNEMRIGIEYGCFMNCRNLTEVKNAAVIHSISDWAFMNCVNLTAINLDGIEDISKLAFSGCVKLKQVFIGEKIKYIGYNAFANCNEELSVTVTATEPPEIKYGVFDGIEHLTIKVPADSMESYKNAEGWNEYSDKIIKIAQ